MNRINLMPPEILEQEAMRERTRRFIFVSVIVLAVFAAIFLALLSMTLIVKGQTATVRMKRAEVQKQASSYGSYTRLQTQLENTDALVKKLVGGSVDWKLLTDKIQTSVPPNVWLTEMKLSGNTVDMKGMTYNAGAVADWVDRLSKNPVVKSVTFKNLDERTSSSSTDIDDEALTAFELTVTFDRNTVKIDLGQGEV